MISLVVPERKVQLMRSSLLFNSVLNLVHSTLALKGGGAVVVPASASMVVSMPLRLIENPVALVRVNATTQLLESVPWGRL